MNDYLCQNCGKQGHIYHQCKIPIMSFGIICFRYGLDKNEKRELQYLLIRRKDTLGYIDFLRGKYSVYNKYYIMNMFKQMTQYEKQQLKIHDFNTLWGNLWGKTHIYFKYKSEENISREKFNQLSSGIYLQNENTNENINNFRRVNVTDCETFYSLATMIDESEKGEIWQEQEWGFPKGRRNSKEKDIDCALREFSEETGYSSSLLKIIENCYPYEEIFMGSNYKSYKHKYYLAYMSYKDSLDPKNFDINEVSKLEWKSFEDCMKSIRSYNVEKKIMFTNINEALTSNLPAENR
jgi:8-oxo-dGTP pyrophosphatase MutT (NUDIX family)